ncbi:MAG TPA: hypothetical protein DCY80_15275 [Solibacterales bacterium]|nr:hypothetical protein [Bryobacterales bacterium]
MTGSSVSMRSRATLRRSFTASWLARRARMKPAMALVAPVDSRTAVMWSGSATRRCSGVSGGAHSGFSFAMRIT